MLLGVLARAEYHNFGSCVGRAIVEATQIGCTWSVDRLVAHQEASRT